MKTVIIHGQSHQGSTYHAAHLLADELGGEVHEFRLPQDFDEFCTGCSACFLRSEQMCPHRAKLEPIVAALDAADVIILASPVYVMRASGPMKAFLDHLGYRFMVHRPEAAMFSKQGVCVTTTAAAGKPAAMKDMEASLFWWGVGRIYKAGFTVYATGWDGVSPAKRRRIARKMASIAARIRRRAGRIRPGIRTRIAFSVVRMLRRFVPGDADREYWSARGWLGKDRPWHRKPADQTRSGYSFPNE